MTVKVDQSVTQDADARKSMYCAVLQVIHDTMGTSTLSDTTGIQSTELLDREGAYSCDLDRFESGSIIKDPIVGGSAAGAEDGGIPLGVTMSFVVAGGMIAFTALFVHRRRKQHRRSAGDSSSSSMDMDTTIVDGGATSFDIARSGIDPPPSQHQPPSPMSAYTSSSSYMTDNHADDTLVMANSEENWLDVDLTASSSSDYGIVRYENV
jgi:hypothetical protein